MLGYSTAAAAATPKHLTIACDKTARQDCSESCLLVKLQPSLDTHEETNVGIPAFQILDPGTGGCLFLIKNSS